MQVVDNKPSRGSPDGASEPPRSNFKLNKTIKISNILNALIVFVVSPPPKARKSENLLNGTTTDVFSSDPFFTADPFGMADFAVKSENKVLDGFGDSNVFNGFSNTNNNATLANGTVNYNNISNLFSSSAVNNGTNNINMTAQNNLANNMKVQPQQIETALQFLDQKIEEMKVGFSRGILNDDFPLESLDPLKSS